MASVAKFYWMKYFLQMLVKKQSYFAGFSLYLKGKLTKKII